MFFILCFKNCFNFLKVLNTFFYHFNFFNENHLIQTLATKLSHPWTFDCFKKWEKLFECEGEKSGTEKTSLKLEKEISYADKLFP